MTVGGIHGLFSNNYNVQQIQTPYVNEPAKIERPADITEQNQQPDLPQQNDNLTTAAKPVQENGASRVADLDQVSLKFNKEESFGYIGMDSSLDNLDMQKAISDMQKDQVLQSYQYFVGSAGSLFGEQSSADGMVVPKT